MQQKTAFSTANLALMDVFCRLSPSKQELHMSHLWECYDELLG